MNIEHIGGIELAVCPSCGGVWFDADQLRILLSREPDALAELATTDVPAIEQRREGLSQLCCPHDGTTLQEHHYLYDSPAILHSCPACGGFWVSENDMTAMAEAWHRAHQPLTPQERAGIVLAAATTEHNHEMARIARFTGLMNTLRRYQPGWLGFLPFP